MKARLNKQQWQVLLAEQEQSGLTVAAFCRDKNLNAKNFYNHRSNKLRKNTEGAPTFVRAQLQSNSRNDSELILNYGKVQLRLSTSSSPQWLAELMASLA